MLLLFVYLVHIADIFQFFRVFLKTRDEWIVVLSLVCSLINLIDPSLSLNLFYILEYKLFILPRRCLLILTRWQRCPNKIMRVHPNPPAPLTHTGSIAACHPLLLPPTILHRIRFRSLQRVLVTLEYLSKCLFLQLIWGEQGFTPEWGCFWFHRGDSSWTVDWCPRELVFHFE